MIDHILAVHRGACSRIVFEFSQPIDDRFDAIPVGCLAWQRAKDFFAKSLYLFRWLFVQALKMGVSSDPIAMPVGRLRVVSIFAVGELLKG